MTKTKRTIYLVLGSFVFLSAVTIINPLQSSDLFGAIVKQVKVVNGPDMPVSVNVENMPVVKADQMGHWIVGINNTTTNPIPVVVQNGNNNGQEKELVEFVQFNVPLATTIALFTVPVGKKLHITDVIVHAIFTRLLEIHRNGNVISRFRLDQDGTSTFGHSYISGIEFQEGDILSVRDASGSFGQNGFELRGYLSNA